MPLPPFVEYFVVCGLDAKSLDKEASSSSGETFLHTHYSNKEEGEWWGS